MYAMRHFGRIREDSRANNAAHHDHRGVEQPELATRFRSLFHPQISQISTDGFNQCLRRNLCESAQSVDLS